MLHLELIWRVHPHGRHPVYRLWSHIYHPNNSPPPPLSCYTWHTSYTPPLPRAWPICVIFDDNLMFETEQYTICGILITISEDDKDSDYFSKCKTRNICKNSNFVIKPVWSQIYFVHLHSLIFCPSALSDILSKCTLWYFDHSDHSLILCSAATFFSFMWAPQERPFKSTLSAAISHPVGCLLPYYIAFLLCTHLCCYCPKYL